MSERASRKKARTAAGETDYVAISATVPRSVVSEARSRYAKRNFSEFVARAMARELVREAQDAYLTVAESEHAIDEAIYEEFRRLLTS